MNEVHWNKSYMFIYVTEREKYKECMLMSNDSKLYTAKKMAHYLLCGTREQFENVWRLFWEEEKA